jgi:hypothetical protein
MIRRTGSARSGERRRARKQARTATSATDITRYRSAGGAICRLTRVIRWFGDFSVKCRSNSVHDRHRYTGFEHDILPKGVHHLGIRF